MFHVIVLDSSFIIAFYLSEDSNHEKALKLAEQNSEETMLLSDVILFETLTVLNYKAGIKRAKEAYDELLGNRYIQFLHFTEIEKNEILAQFFEQKKKLSFADSSVVYLAGRGKIRVLTFDKEILAITKSFR